MRYLAKCSRSKAVYSSKRVKNKIGSSGTSCADQLSRAVFIRERKHRRTMINCRIRGALRWSEITREREKARDECLAQVLSLREILGGLYF